MTLLDSGKVDYVISTSAKGRDPHADSVKMRRHAVERDNPCLTSLDTANAIADCLASNYDVNNVELVDINDLRTSREKLHFYKMECTGNDFILIDTAEQPINNPEGLAVRLCNRRDSIGADSLIIVEKSRKAHAKMRFFNQDGSEGKAAGNAIRAVAKYLYDNNVYGVADKHSRITDPTAIISVETAVGIKKLVLYKLEGKVSSVTVEMGNPIFEPTQIPTTLETTQNGAIVNAPLDVDGMSYNATCVNIGNPHCVVFSSFVDKVDVEKIGPIFEKHEVYEFAAEEFASYYAKISGEYLPRFNKATTDAIPVFLGSIEFIEKNGCTVSTNKLKYDGYFLKVTKNAILLDFVQKMHIVFNKKSIDQTNIKTSNTS